MEIKPSAVINELIKHTQQSVNVPAILDRQMGVHHQHEEYPLRNRLKWSSIPKRHEEVTTTVSITTKWTEHLHFKTTGRQCRNTNSNSTTSEITHMCSINKL
jgi:hypothetical protein